MDEEALRVSRPASRGPRPRGSGCWTAALLASILVAATAGSAAAEDAAPPPGPRADCTTCGGSGKAACGNCGGKGEIWKPCPICEGNGRKPCPVCASEERRASSFGPGRLVCTLCGGKGVRASGRTCSRCLGEQSVACTTCIGKGTLRCRKQVFDRVCPACRFVGKVDCPTCKGGPRVTVGKEIAAKRARAQETDATANGKAAAGDLEARYARLSSLHDGHMDIFGDDPRPGLEPLRGEASRALKSLRAEGAADAASADAIESLLSRLGSFRRRWGEIRELFLDEHRSFRTAKGVWASRERLVADARGSLRAVAEKQWAERMDTALTIAEQRASALEAAEPAWLPKEATDLATIWTDLRVSAESDLALASAAAKVRSDARPVNAPGDAGVEEEGGEEAVSNEDLFAPAGAAAMPEERDGDAVVEAASSDFPPPPAAAAGTAAALPRSSRKEPARRESAQAEVDPEGAGDEAPADGKGEGPSAPRSWAPIVWSAAGFAAATLLFGFLGRRGRSRSRG